MTARVTVITVAYQSGDRLVRCVDSVLDRPPDDLAVDLVIVNNGEHGAEIDKVAARDEVTLVEPGENLGFGAGCNVGARHATGDVLVFLNPDAEVVGDALARLAAAAQEPGGGIVMPLVVLRDEPDVLNSAGGVVHVTGLGWAGSHGEPVATAARHRTVAAASGAAMTMRAGTFRELGGFCEELFLYHEDAELSWRAHLMGLPVVALGDAVVTHDYDFGRNPTKLGLMERNRIVFVTTLFSTRLLLAVAPVLAVYELGIVALAARQGWLGEKAAGWRWLWRNRRWLRHRRRDIQGGRVVADRDVVPLLASRIEPAMIEVPAALGVMNAVFAWYWSLVRRFV